MTQEQIEGILDTVLEEASSGELLPVEFSKFLLDEHPVIFDYLFSSDITLLTDEEGDFAFFLAAVFIESIRRWKAVPANIRHEDLEEFEETMWQRIEDAQRESHVGILPTALPEDMNPEIGEFILDALEDEPDFLTLPGKQLIFVKLCTIVQAL